jgi:hypothetical protein
MKNSIYQIKTQCEESLAEQVKQKKEYQGLKVRLRKYCTQTQIKKKLNKHDQNLQELWDMIKGPNLKIHRVEEGTEIQNRGIKNY